MKELNSVNQNTRNWELGVTNILEKDSWCNLRKIWHIFKDFSPLVTKAVSNGREASIILMRMGARYGGLNPVIAVGLWRRIRHYKKGGGMSILKTLFLKFKSAAKILNKYLTNHVN